MKCPKCGSHLKNKRTRQISKTFCIVEYYCFKCAKKFKADLNLKTHSVDKPITFEEEKKWERPQNNFCGGKSQSTTKHID